MWTKRKKEKDVHRFDSTSPDGGSTMEAGSEAALETEDSVFPHPGGYGIMMMPLRIFESGIFSGRLWKSRVTFVYSKGGDTGHRYASSARQTGLPREQLDSVQIENNPFQQHPLCSGNPARVDDVVEEAHRARVVEQALREEVHSLQTNKELMTEAHRAQLDKLRQELEADAKESRLRLETELEKSHAISLNSLRKTLGSETNRLREDLAHARQEATKSISRSSSRKVNGFGGFWKSFEVFGPSGTPQEVPDSKSVELVDGITAYPFAALTTLVPPALFVLVTVPLFCLLSNRRRQRMIAFNVGGGNNGDEIEAPGVEVEPRERSPGLDKIEGGEENRPLVQDGQGVEAQGGNNRISSFESSPCRMVSRPSIELEAARSTGRASAAENMTALSSQHAQNIPEVHIKPATVLASETPLRRRSLQQDSFVSADGVGNGTLAGSTEFPLGARETENTEVRPRENGTISMGRRLLTSSSTSSPERSTPATKVGQQPKERLESLCSKPVVCSPPRRLYAERHNMPALVGEADRGDGSIARVNCSPSLTQSPAVGRVVLESLRRERDALANTCGRLEAEREVLSIRLRESAEHVMKLDRASDALEKEKSCLIKRCVVLEKEIEACGKEGRCTGVSMDRDGRVMELEKRVSERERERDETAALVAEKETRLASLTAKVEELQEALATTSATAAAAAADSTHFFSAAAALATAETQAAERAADATQALASKEEEAQELKRRVRALEEEKQMVVNNLKIAEAEKESCENLAKDLQGRIADQEMELKQLMVELETERKASAAAVAASSSEPREEALFESHSKLAVLDSASVTAAADLEEAKCQLQRLQVENAEQQTLFDSKVSDLAVAASRILKLEDSTTRYLARQRELEDEVKGLREETERLESAIDELQDEAIAKEEERASELDCFRREVADLSSRLESSGVDKTAAESEIRRLQRDMETRCYELNREKEAQAAMYEQRLNEHAVELNANALAKEAAGRKREELEASHAKHFQALLEENASPPSDVEVSRGLLEERTQELAALDAKAGSVPPLLEERASVMERKAEEADILRREVSRLSSELKALSLANDEAASVALNEKTVLLADAKKRQRRLEAKVEQETEAAAELERQVAVGKKRIEELARELEAERSSATKAAETSAAEIVKLREHICFKESQINGRADKVKLELEEKTLELARTEERVLVLEAEREDIAYMIKDIRNDKEKYVAELKKKREKTAVELKDIRDAQREAEKRCRELEEENEAMADDYEGRLQQQASNYEERIAKAQNGEPRAGAEVERLQLHINEIEESRKLTARKLREIMKKYSENEEKFMAALDNERERADRLDRMLEDSRRERDADWERLHQNMDSLKEQLDVKSSTVKYLWEKVAATRREKGVGNEELKTKLDEANEVRANLEHLVEEQEEQIERLRRRAKRRDEEITQTVMSRLEAQSVEEEDCSLADIKTERKMLVAKYQVLEQQVSDLKKLVDEITKLEHGVPEIACEASLEVLSVCSDISQESTYIIKAVEDIPEAELRELVSWFRERGLERRRLLKRYRAGRLKTEALDAKKKAGIDPFASARGQKLPLKKASGRSPNSDAGSVKSVHSTRSGVNVVSNLSPRMANEESGVGNSSRRGKKPRPRDRSVSPRPLTMGVGTGRGVEACADVATSMARNKVSRSAARSDLSASVGTRGGSGLKSPRTTNRAT